MSHLTKSFRNFLSDSIKNGRFFPYEKIGEELYYVKNLPSNVCWLFCLMNLARRDAVFAMGRFYEENQKDLSVVKTYKENRVLKLSGKRVYLSDVYCDFFEQSESQKERSIDVLKQLCFIPVNYKDKSVVIPFLLGVLNNNDELHRINLWAMSEGYVIIDDSNKPERLVMKTSQVEVFIKNNYKQIVSITGVFNEDDSLAFCHEDGTLK